MSAKCQKATSLGFDTKCETTLDLVGVGRHRTPIHLVDSRIQRFETYAHGVVVDLSLALTDLSAARVRAFLMRLPVAAIAISLCPTCSFCALVNACASQGPGQKSNHNACREYQGR
jgi:hypothetical protein